MSPRDAKELSTLARRLLNEGPVRTLATQRRVRILHGGVYVADTTDALYVWEHPAYPYFYLPDDAFDHSKLSLESIDAISGGDGGSARHMRMEVNGKAGSGTDRILSFVDGGRKASDLTGRIRVEFGAVDQWLEEDTPIIVHPKDPFKRVDLLTSTRHIRICVPHPQSGAEITLAETQFAVHLYETSLPVRYYMPLTSINPSLIRNSARNTRTQCPYKGDAEYYDVVLEDGSIMPDLIWYYRSPTVECAAVQGLCCFYSEKVDIHVDGQKQERPKTWFV